MDHFIKNFIKKNKKKEQGAISLFVLVAMLFFLLTVTNMYTLNSNENQQQLEEIKKIEKEYMVTDEEMDDIYAELVEEM